MNNFFLAIFLISEYIGIIAYYNAIRKGNMQQREFIVNTYSAAFLSILNIVWLICAYYDSAVGILFAIATVLNIIGIVLSIRKKKCENNRTIDNGTDDVS